MGDQIARGEYRLRASGKRITLQRSLIVNVLSRAGSHLDAAEIYERARTHDPRLSLSTVYRTLGTLKEIGLVRESHLDADHHHYELDPHDGHSHLVCLACGRVVEVDGEFLVEAARSLGQAHGFEITRSHLELTGYCADCHPHTANRASSQDPVNSAVQRPVRGESTT